MDIVLKIYKRDKLVTLREVWTTFRKTSQLGVSGKEARVLSLRCVILQLGPDSDRPGCLFGITASRFCNPEGNMVDCDVGQVYGLGKADTDLATKGRNKPTSTAMHIVP